MGGNGRERTAVAEKQKRKHVCMCRLVLTAHIGLGLVFDEGVATRLASVLVVDHFDLLSQEVR